LKFKNANVIAADFDVNIIRTVKLIIWKELLI